MAEKRGYTFSIDSKSTKTNLSLQHKPVTRWWWLFKVQDLRFKITISVSTEKDCLDQDISTIGAFSPPDNLEYHRRPCIARPRPGLSRQSPYVRPPWDDPERRYIYTGDHGSSR